MLSQLSTWAPLALLLGVKALPGKDHGPEPFKPNEASVHDVMCTSNVTVFDTTTILSSTTVPITHYVDVTVPCYVNVTVSSTKTSTVLTCITESTTTTLHYTVSVTETDSATITNTQITTLHDTVSVIETDSATITNTQTTTTTVPATTTTYTTQTVISTFVNPCPTTCSISAETVNLFFWPTDRPYTYPSTYINTALAYTFTSPSVYMFIPTAVGTNSLGRTGPSISSWMLALDLDEVSTIFDGTVTRQLTLSDLGTDCPQTAAPSAIATMVDSRCDPILAAPKQVSSWAYPCNACGRFGLFDPPYAIPTLPGGLIATATPAPVATTHAPPPTSTATTSTTSEILSNPHSALPTSSTSEIVSNPHSALPTSLSSSTTTPTASPQVSSASSVAAAPATRVTGGFASFISSIFLAVLLL